VIVRVNSVFEVPAAGADASVVLSVWVEEHL